MLNKIFKTLHENALIDTKGNKVLFAEAGMDFVDFLFNLLSLPAIRTVSHLRTDQV